MSDRMTDEEFETGASALCTIEVPWPQLADYMEREARRARASEAAKDATIKALADALSESAPLFSVANGPCWGCHSPVPADDADHRDDCRKRRTALRLVGRL